MTVLDPTSSRANSIGPPLGQHARWNSSCTHGRGFAFLSVCRALALWFLGCPALPGAELAEAPEGTFSFCRHPGHAALSAAATGRRRLGEFRVRRVLALDSREHRAPANRVCQPCRRYCRPQRATSMASCAKVHGQIAWSCPVRHLGGETTRHGAERGIRRCFRNSFRSRASPNSTGTEARSPGRGRMRLCPETTPTAFSSFRLKVCGLSSCTWNATRRTTYSTGRTPFSRNMLTAKPSSRPTWGSGPRDRPKAARDFFDAPKGRMTWTKCHGKRWQFAATDVGEVLQAASQSVHGLLRGSESHTGDATGIPRRSRKYSTRVAFGLRSERPARDAFPAQGQPHRSSDLESRLRRTHAADEDRGRCRTAPIRPDVPDGGRELDTCPRSRT